ncbi:protein tyrosine phosphatase domain-containing protein 1 [Neosynchiropus ocellatus]
MIPSVSLHIPVPRPAYSQARENLVRAIPPRILCLLACGGVDCRYEGPECWKSSQQVICGLFSSWVTDDIIAMARPSKRLIEKYDIIDQFHRLNIRSLINMQIPGEHAHCGPPLDPDSGFTYSPQSFMDHNIYFYNFGMPDFGVSSLVGIIDGVKVLAFAVRQGRVAVHCHAGLGRTGVLIACYLIYTLRISPSEAVHFVRVKRPRSIQTRAQISQVFDFARLLGTQLVQYPDLNLRHGAPFTLQHYLNRQALLLHGQEARTLRHTPKVLYLLCTRLSCLALGLPSPPAINAELEKRSRLRTLGRTVRETLVSKQYLPLLRDSQGSTRWGLGSVSSWDEPLEFLERRSDWLLQRRSYSDSELCRVTLNKDLELCPKFNAPSSVGGDWCAQEVTKADTAQVCPEHLLDPVTKRESHSFKLPNSRSSSGQLPKRNSNFELNRQHHHPASTSAARAIAKALAERSPAGEAVLQKSALLQEELNSSDCGWALMVTESDPEVLTCLLWTWLEKLKDPVLSPEDVDKLVSRTNNNRNPLSVLKKPQKHTIYCLLSAVRTVTGLCPHREEAVLHRLIRALTRLPPEEVTHTTTVTKLLRRILRETFHNSI